MQKAVIAYVKIDFGFWILDFGLPVKLKIEKILG